MPVQNITLNVVPSGVPPIVNVSQNDNGWTIQLSLMKGTNPYQLSSDYTYTLCGTKPTGTGFSYDDAVTLIGSNVLSFNTNTVMTAVAGDVRCGIIIYDGDEHVETLNFIMHVQRTALDTDTIIDSDDFGSIITEAVVNWMDEYGVVIDDQLETPGAAADAKVTGDKLRDLKSALNWCITPEMFGAKGDGETDDSSAINAALAYALDNGFPLLMGKRGAIYGVASPIILNASKSKVTFDFNDASVKAISDIEEIFKIDSASNVWNQMRNVYIDGNGLAEYGIYCQYVSTFHFEHIKIVDFKNTALYIRQGNCIVHDMYINYTLSGVNASPIGILNEGTDSKFHNVTMRNCKIGVYNKGGLTYYANIHPWISNADILPGSIAFWCRAGTSLTNCYADTYYIGVQIDGQQAVTLNGFDVFINRNYYTTEVMSDEAPIVFNFMSTTQGLAHYPAAATALMLSDVRLNMTLDEFTELAKFSNIYPDQLIAAMRSPECIASVYAPVGRVEGIPLKQQSLFTINQSAYPHDIASGSVAFFPDGADGLPVLDLTVSIEPVQSGSGDPSPSNVRPITGWTGLTLSQSGADTSDPDTLSIDWTDEAGTVYGGTLDVTTGLLTVDRAYALLNDANKWLSITGTVKAYYNVLFNDRKQFSDSYTSLMCSYLQVKSGASETARWRGADINTFGLNTTVPLEQIKADAEAGKIAISYELAEPVTYQLTPQEVETLLGTNNIWANTGDTSVEYRADTKLYIDKKIAELSAQIVNA